MIGLPAFLELIAGVFGKRFLSFGYRLGFIAVSGYFVTALHRHQVMKSLSQDHLN